jgi:hypothetical protein
MSVLDDVANLIGGRFSRPGGKAVAPGYQTWKVCLLCVAVLVAAVGCEQKTAKTRPDQARAEASGTAKGADKAASESGPEGVGKSCETIEDCDSYLSCIEGSCQVPPAVTGRHESDTPRVTFIDGNGDEVAEFYVELAITQAEQTKGLMFRREMKDDWGMLFIYPDEAPRSFWMQNTFIPLDMIFIDGRGRVVNIIEAAEPLTRVRRQSKGPTRYVLELVAGRAAEVGIEPGQKLQLDHIDEKHAPRAQK